VRDRDLAHTVSSSELGHRRDHPDTLDARYATTTTNAVHTTMAIIITTRTSAI
jgi:hypothetical protein